MTPQETFNDIESISFAVRLNLASGIKHFIQLLRNEPSVKALINAMNKDIRLKADIFDRVVELSKRLFDKGYEHPNDAAIAAYVWLLGIMDPEKDTWKAAADIATSIPQTWWARKISKFIDQTDSSITVANPTQLIQEPPSEAVLSVATSNASSNMLRFHPADQSVSYRAPHEPFSTFFVFFSGGAGHPHSCESSSNQETPRPTPSLVLNR